MSNREWQIGICGTFDVENYGDLLFPLIAEVELARRLGQVTLHRFSYQPRTTPYWPYAVSSVAELPAMASKLDGIIIGGGLLVRFDKEIAPGYGPPTRMIHHPTGYWLTPMMIALQHNCPVVWNAPGVHGDIPTWAEPLLELAVNLSSYVAVRDETSRQALSPLAKMTTEIKVVPDTAFGISEIINIERPSAEYVRLRENLGLTDPYIIVQATNGLQAFSRLVRNHPEIFRGYQLVILPIGPILGDDTTIFDSDLPGSIRVRLLTWPNPLLLAELIGQASGVVGISLHLTITSLTFGVPVFRPAGTFDGKFALLLEFDTIATFESESEIDPQWFAAKLGRTKPSPTVLAMIKRLPEHWDNISSIIANNDGTTATLETLGHFWQSMPSLLETWAIRHTAARDELDSVYNSTSWKITAPLRAFAHKLRRQKHPRR